jgi:hypothetical protein
MALTQSKYNTDREIKQGEIKQGQRSISLTTEKGSEANSHPSILQAPPLASRRSSNLGDFSRAPAYRHSTCTNGLDTVSVDPAALC